MRERESATDYPSSISRGKSKRGSEDCIVKREINDAFNLSAIVLLFNFKGLPFKPKIGFQPNESAQFSQSEMYFR